MIKTSSKILMKYFEEGIVASFLLLLLTIFLKCQSASYGEPDAYAEGCPPLCAYAYLWAWAEQQTTNRLKEPNVGLFFVCTLIYGFKLSLWVSRTPNISISTKNLKKPQITQGSRSIQFLRITLRASDISPYRQRSK